jgi:hypothetical protein
MGTKARELTNTKEIKDAMREATPVTTAVVSLSPVPPEVDAA